MKMFIFKNWCPNLTLSEGTGEYEHANFSWLRWSDALLLSSLACTKLLFAFFALKNKLITANKPCLRPFPTIRSCSYRTLWHVVLRESCSKKVNQKSSHRLFKLLVPGLQKQTWILILLHCCQRLQFSGLRCRTNLNYAMLCSNDP